MFKKIKSSETLVLISRTSAARNLLLLFIFFANKIMKLKRNYFAGKSGENTLKFNFHSGVANQKLEDKIKNRKNEKRNLAEKNLIERTILEKVLKAAVNKFIFK